MQVVGVDGEGVAHEHEPEGSRHRCEESRPEVEGRLKCDRNERGEGIACFDRPMKEALLCLPILAMCVVLIAGCAGIERAPRHRPPAAAPAESIVSIRPQPAPAAKPTGASPSLTTEDDAVASAPVGRAPEPARPGATGGNLAKPALSTPQSPAKRAASPAPAAPPPAAPPVAAPPVAKPAVPPPLDLKSLETRLKETNAIGVFTKLALKNQIDDLLERFRAFYQGRIKTSLVELRRSFDMLVMKTLALLQDADPPLAGSLASSRESIWGILSDPAKFATI